MDSKRITQSFKKERRSSRPPTRISTTKKDRKTLNQSSESNSKPQLMLKTKIPVESYNDDSNDLESLLRPYRYNNQLKNCVNSPDSKQANQFAEDRRIVKVQQQSNSSSSTRIQMPENENPVKKFEDKIERLHRQHKISVLKSSIKRIDAENDDKRDWRAEVHPVVFRKPAKKNLFNLDKPNIGRISFGSRRKTCEFKIIDKEEYCLRNSHIFSNKLISNGGDDDCDTDDPELDKARIKCRMDLYDGYNRTIRRMEKEKRNKTMEPNVKKYKRRTTSYLKTAF